MRRLHCAAAGMLALGVVTLAALCLSTALGWWGRTFPGFVVTPNRVVASVSLSGWPAEGNDVFLAEIVSVDGRPIRTGGDVYAHVAAKPAGTSFVYGLRREARTWSQALPSRVFTGSNAALVFGSFLLNGLIFGLVSIAVWALRPELPAARAMLVFGLAVAAYVLAAGPMYDASPVFLRLHALAETLLPAAVLQLALVFPTWRRLGWHRRAMVTAWTASLAVALAWQIVLFDAARFVAVGNLCCVGFGVGLAVFIVRCVTAYRRGSALERTKIGVVVLSALPAGILPAVLFALSGLTDGRVPVNSAGFTAFLFPLGLGYAIVRHDLFEIDTVVRRLVHYVVLTVLMMLLYGAVLLVSADVLHLDARSPLLPLHFALGIVLLLLPLRDRAQGLVDRVCFRQRYDARTVLERTSLALGSTLDVEIIAATVLAQVDDALSIEAGALYVAQRDGGFAVAGEHGMPWSSAPAIEPTDVLVRQLARNRVVSWYSDDGDAEPPIALGAVQSHVLVPMAFRDRPIGFLALGPRRSGQYYRAHDIQFLRTLANQAALSILHAQAYQELHELTLTLEHKVSARTMELEESVHHVREAYRELEQSQERLICAEKTATLGRLAAGVAHEVSTPLGATMTDLRVARELVAEYANAIDDTRVTPDDHRTIARELDEMVSQAQQWTEKAAKFILAMKAHTRGYDDGTASNFEVARVVDETALLLQHRATATSCGLRVMMAEDLPRLHGDPIKLGQVLTNLITNGLDAYESARRMGDVEIAVTGERETIVVTVTDRGCGIAPEHLPRIFEELFTTKPPGRGTGLGLAIVRDLVHVHFGGTIEVVSVPDQGTTFTLRFPAARDDIDVDAAPTFADRRPSPGVCDAAHLVGQLRRSL